MDGDEHLPLDHVGIPGHGLEVVHRAAGQAGGHQDIHALRGGLVLGPLLDDGLEQALVVPAEVGVVEALVVKELRMADGGAELLEHGVVAAGHDEVGVLGHEGVIGGGGQIPVAGPGRGLPADQVLGQQRLLAADGGLQQGHVDLLALAGLDPLVQGADDADGGVQARQHVAQRDARPGGGIVGPAGDGHGARHGLGHQVIAGAGGIGAGLAEAGDRGIDQPGVDLAAVLIGEAQPGHDAGAVVFQQNVGRGHQLGKGFLALGGL